MLKRRINIWIGGLLLTNSFMLTANSQDLHFSQFMNSPLLINPANTGFIPDGDFRLGANYRNQWASVSAFPYKSHWQTNPISFIFE